MDATYTLAQIHAGFDDVINEVRHGRKTVQLTDHGKPVAAIVPVEFFSYMAQLEDELALVETTSKAPGKSRGPSTC